MNAAASVGPKDAGAPFWGVETIGARMAGELENLKLDWKEKAGASTGMAPKKADSRGGKAQGKYV